jgi:predicted amidohydrolase
MRAHLIQLDVVWEDKQANYRRVLKLLDRAALPPAPGEMIVLPEMFDTGFSFNLEKTADRDFTTIRFLQALAKETGCFVVGARTTIGHEGKGRNRCPIINPAGELIDEYEKIHPFSYGEESKHFVGGSKLVTFDWTGGGDAARPQTLKVCPTICYDLRFPELYRHGLLAGAEVFTVIASWPAPRKLHRRALAVARAIENQAFVLCLNRAGGDPKFTYQGESFAVGPKGDIIAEAGSEESILSVQLDPAALRSWRSDFPAWKDIRLIGH